MLKILSDPGVIGSVIGGLIGGFFTYLAVILTFEKQKKDELPSKLLALTEIMFLIKAYEKNLNLLLDCIYSDRGDATRYFPALEFDDFKSNLVFKSLSVDKKTYQIIFKTFLEYTELDYYKITVLFDSNKGYLYKNTVDAAEGLVKDLSTLKAQLIKRVIYYEKKLK